MICEDTCEDINCIFTVKSEDVNIFILAIYLFFALIKCQMANKFWFAIKIFLGNLCTSLKNFGKFQKMIVNVHLTFR